MDSRAAGVTRAAVWEGNAIAVREVRLPEPGPGETLIRISAATVCGSDLHTVSGRRPAPCPSILGHEAVGVVVATGADSPVSVGDRVVWSVTVSCGECPRCRAGLSAKCCSVRKVGHESFAGDWPLSGGYAEHILLPAGTAFARVPESMPDVVAAPAACATATVMATLEAAGPVTGRRVLILGAGMLGVTAVAACSVADADVRVVDLDEQRADSATGFGARPDDGGPADVVIDFTGSTPAIAAALGRLDVGATMVLAGSVLPAPPLAVDPETVVRRWLTLTGVHNYEPRHLTRAVEFLETTQADFDWAELVGSPVPLERISSVMSPPGSGRLRSAVAP